MKRLGITFLVCFSLHFSILSQSYYYVPDHEAYHLVDRLDIKYGSEEFHSSFRNFTRKEAVALASQSDVDQNEFARKFLLLDNIDLLELERSNNQVTIDTTYEGEGIFYTTYTRKEETIDPMFLPQKGIFNRFYKSRANFFEVHTDNFNLIINPVVHLAFGTESDNENLIFQNTRGLELRGDIDSKLYFFSSIYENQADFNDFRLQRINRFQTIPGQGFFKNFTSSVSGRFSGFDYLNSRAYLGLNISKSVALEIGHGNQFIGNGYRSLLLSDWSHNYFNFKFILNVWKFNYESVFAELAAAPERLIPGDQLIPKKYISLHYLSFKPTKNFEIGLFETVVFARENQFELQYLNPVILYRTVEGLLGSSDNAILGLNLKYNIANKFSIYHQTVLDEFRLSEIFSGNGWWANKFGFQFGAKAIDLGGIKNLDAQVEYNIVRPYTYTHRDTLPLQNIENISIANYAHHSQPLAHPIGANFKEFVFILRYQLGDKLNLTGRYIRTNYGEDVNGSNWGTNILLPLESREQDFGNFVGQGESIDVNLFGLNASYMFYHNMFLDLNVLLRNQTSSAAQFNFSTQYVSLGVRVNASLRNVDY